MARSRNIKHGLYLNEEIAELSIQARYLFPCLWCLADKEGRIEYRPKKIKAEAYPYDDIDIPGLLMELHEKQFISVYGNGDRAFIQVNNWAKHQSPHPKEKASIMPSITDEASIVASVEYREGHEKQFKFTAKPRPDREIIPDVLIPDVLIPDSLPLIPRDENPARMMAMSEIHSLYLQCTGQVQAPGGIGPVLQEIREKYNADTIRESFMAAAANTGVELAGFLNWCRKRMERKPQADRREDDYVDLFKRAAEKNAAQGA